MFQLAQEQTSLRNAITEAYRKDEENAVMSLISQAQFDQETAQATEALARTFMQKVRENRNKTGGVDALMQKFSLSSEEGVALMCVAEALLRIPDKATQERLIRDKLAHGDWMAHVGKGNSLFANAASWGLLVTGKLTASHSKEGLSAGLTRILAKGGEPLIRQSMNIGMKVLGKQFVTGQTIEDALKHGKKREEKGYCYSFDMLGEAALTQKDADHYFSDYVMAIHTIGKDAKGVGVYAGNGISVKLSAIHPRFSRAQKTRVMSELLPRLRELFLLAKQYDIGLNIDAEEADRLELSLDLLEAIATDPELAGFKGIGFVVQAYQKRCPFVIDYLIDLAGRSAQRLMVRLVKGAYWDAEIKRAQVDGLSGYPVYTRKVYTDVSYIACAKKLLAAPEQIFPQFATHNAYTLSLIYQLAQNQEYEFQCLHGMGETLYDQVVGKDNLDKRCRIYAPVGAHDTLLAYLVRRLLENGANSSFVNQIVDETISIDTLVANPLIEAARHGGKAHSKLPLPVNLYGAQRLNSKGMDLSNEQRLNLLQINLNAATTQCYQASSLLAEEISLTPNWQDVHSPANHGDIVGQVSWIDSPATIDAAVAVAKAYQSTWATVSPAERARMILRFADLLEKNTPVLLMLAIREAGKTLSNAIGEVREAVDFCRYYAAQSTTELHHPPHQPLGVIVTISPWNFPLSIFVGELVAALLAGNSVLAKPAGQTSLMAHYAVTLLHQAGVPKNACQLLLGEGALIGNALTAHPDINGVIFTGSIAVARQINQNLAKREDYPVLIAETGGQNAMIVDSSALPEQVVTDVLQSAFDSAGQRCSALRVLYLQEDIADKVITMLRGALDELSIGNPVELSTDIGPVIDQEAQVRLLKHIEYMKTHAKAYYERSLPDDYGKGTFVVPVLFEMDNLDELKEEVFGPVLHIIRYHADELDRVIEQINATGYALTHGIHSRINQTVNHICERVNAGNIYVNRNIVGAVVGVQPFGGHGFSGTGPKAGGFFYLQRLSQARQWTLPAKIHSKAEFSPQLQTLENKLTQCTFLDEGCQNSLKEAIAQAKQQNLFNAWVVLAGPTGESNLLYLRARQHIFIYVTEFCHKMLDVLTKVAAAGSTAWVTKDSPLVAFAHHMPEFVKITEDPLKSPAHLWLAVNDVPVALKEALAERTGSIVTIIDAQNAVNLPQLMNEVSISINTAAAGGNASLMAMAED